ncbi:MAG: hypothetical protein IJI68_00305 [Eggerthellaceae bacterium]|nr:hypothetical protein [Eggerthellaceae bacterium]
MRIIAVFAAAAVLAFTLAGCGSSSASSSAESSESMSASDVSASSSAESSSAAQTDSTVKFTKVKTADEAAKGAGIDKFGVFDKITLDDAEYKDPAFAYAEGVAEANYENGAIGLIVRKADGKHTAPLTDRDKTEFAQTWTKSYESLDVTCYGAAKGAATVFTWADGTQEFGVTYQGLGGEEVSLDSDEVAAVVKALKEANAKEQPKKEEPKQEQPKQEESNDNADDGMIEEGGAGVLNGMDPAAIIANAGLGEVVSSTQVQLNDGNWYWQVEARTDDGGESTYVIDVNGNITNVSGEQNDGDDGMIEEGGAGVLNGMDPGAIIANAGLGEVVSSSEVQLDDGDWYWQVEARDDDGDVSTYYIDVNGNISEA